MRFDATTSQTLQQPHTDPLVVTLKIGQMNVKRVLVDTGSTAELITMNVTLKKMKFEEKHLQPLDKPLIGFGGNQVIPLGTIILPVRVGEKDGSRTMPIRFTVVDLTFPYNAIMGCHSSTRSRPQSFLINSCYNLSETTDKLGFSKEIR